MSHTLSAVFFIDIIPGKVLKKFFAFITCEKNTHMLTFTYTEIAISSHTITGSR